MGGLKPRPGSTTEQLTMIISGPSLDDDATDDQLRSKYVALRLAHDMVQKKRELYQERAPAPNATRVAVAFG